MTDTPTCKTCIFRNTFSYCIRFPPTMGLWPNGNQHPVLYSVETLWPWVKETDQCGEHKPIEVKS